MPNPAFTIIVYHKSHPKPTVRCLGWQATQNQTVLPLQAGRFYSGSSGSMGDSQHGKYYLHHFIFGDIPRYDKHRL